MVSSCSRKFQSLIWHEVFKIFDSSYIKVSLTDVHGKIYSSNWPHGASRCIVVGLKMEKSLKVKLISITTGGVKVVVQLI